MLLGLTLWAGIVGHAALAPFRIIIESSSPYYEPVAARVAAGSPIVWENPTASHHTVTHDGCMRGDSCAFDSGALAPDRHFTVPGLPPGHYPYHCELHPIMRGTLIVGDPAAASSDT